MAPRAAAAAAGRKAQPQQRAALLQLVLLRLLLAALPIIAALAAAHASGPGSPLHARLASWPRGQAALERAHLASVEIARSLADARAAAAPALDRLLALRHRLVGGGNKKVSAAAARRLRDAAQSLDAGACQLRGAVDAECCNCTYSAVDSINGGHVHPAVTQLVRTAFFRYFKVNIYCDCPLWPDDSMCSLRACSVCECEEGEVPKTWLAAERSLTSASGGGGANAGDAATCAGAKQPDCNTADCAIEMESQVDRSLEPGMRSRLRHLKGWRGFNNPWMAPPAAGDDGDDYQYINLLANPERYTGYKGEHAHRIWAAIYDAVDAARAAAGGRPEARVFYRLVSGMHASITTHLTADWLLDEDAGLWGPNLDEFDKRLGPAAPQSAERASNLYFAYLLVLRAVLKAGPLLAGLEYDTGLPVEDAQTRRLVTDLLSDPAVLAACPVPFDEGRLWKGTGGAELLPQLQRAFQNITRVMDCVGCEKCKLWGKLQTLGIATALKILFASNDCGPAGGPSSTLPPSQQQPQQHPPPPDDLTLERNEAIALINLLARFSNSLHKYREMSAALAAKGKGAAALAGGVAVS